MNRFRDHKEPRQILRGARKEKVSSSQSSSLYVFAVTSPEHAARLCLLLFLLFGYCVIFYQVVLCYAAKMASSFLIGKPCLLQTCISPSECF